LALNKWGTMMSHDNTQRGFALPAAVFALVIVGVLVTGGFYVARQESRIGVASQHAAQAFYLAERGVSEVIATPDAAMLTSLPIWGDTAVAGTVDGGLWEVEVTRMAQQTYFLDGTGQVTRGGAMLGGATRRVGMIAKFFTANIDPPAALTTQGSLTIGGSSEIIGFDADPDTWGDYCDSNSLQDKAGIMINDTLNIKENGVKVIVDGVPATAEDPSITAESLLDLGGMHFDDLAALADITFPYSLTLTQTAPDSLLASGNWICRPGDYNWGDPLNPGAVCGSRFPIIYATNDLHISSSASGQGILLVEGDLSITGGFEFFGPVIVKGTLSTTGTGGHIRGAVIAANVNLDTSKVLGNALVQYSSCSVSRALLNNSSLTRLRPLAQRSWVDLSNVAG
jgi:hypothetical protein